KQTNFEKIPGSPIAYWASHAMIHDFETGTPLGKLIDPRQGLATSDNKRFIRLWYEVLFQDIDFNETSTSKAAVSGNKWFPFNKGGAYRRWYGNYDYIVNYFNDGEEIKKNVLKKYPYLKTPDFVVKNTRFYFREAITWSDIGSGMLSVRWRSSGSIYGNKGSGAFSDDKDNLFICMGVLNSTVGKSLLDILNPTISRNVGDISKIPILSPAIEITSSITRMIALTKYDWDIDEKSWDFQANVLLKIAEHQKSPPAKFLTLVEFCDKYVPIQFRRLIFYGKLSKTR
ncbi:BREX-1 system adenine-specific DNA-methyltransferase PglX, partial [Lacticaseibacillus rhamnosus]|nr:BREX-1 system adenine-specific DNA-methyltransferase PglX [Lacticaseibacillus rhamnosus]MDB7765322.1 BREX-1 system adenine-specific DNA-methyltransferase PglX [Lacticaseibacillus rhamnosus]MDB7768210.1 BREX-1 system adenine-specific DNA-methyltransferase PglX [Lacticaseibacillus rhamnosus]